MAPGIMANPALWQTRHYGNQENDTQQNDTQQNDTQENDTGQLDYLAPRHFVY
jgi:hypothetical protein